MTTHIQLCFVMDCTGSMQDWIDTARDQIQTIIDQTRKEVEQGLTFEVGFIGYRDFGDAEQHISIPWTRDIDELRQRIRAIRADGGNDCAEDVAGGLMMAVEMFRERTTGVRQVIHIADAPAHGRMFHDIRVSDRYPLGDPNRRDPCAFIHELGTMGIDYTFVRVDSSTDTMLEAFHNSYTASSGIFKVLDLVVQRASRRDNPLRNGRTYSDASSQSADFSPAISRHLAQSINRHTASQDPTEV